MRKTKSPETYKCCGGVKSRGHKKGCRFKKLSPLSPSEQSQIKRETAEQSGDSKRVGKSKVTWGKLFGRKPSETVKRQMALEIVDDPQAEEVSACKVECEDSPDGKCNFTPDLEYDPTGLSISCEYCGQLGSDESHEQAAKEREAAVKTATATRSFSASQCTAPLQTTKLSGFAAHMQTKTSAPHVVVEALAGTGKTFTLIVGVAKVFGSPALWKALVNELGFEPQPSPQQQAVWNALALSKGVKTITYAAFNTSIVNEFGEKWGWLVRLLRQEEVFLQFVTVNALGNSCVKNHYGWAKVDSDRTQLLIADIKKKDIWELRRDSQALLTATSKLVEMCKLTLTGWTNESGLKATEIPDEEFDKLVSHFDIEIETGRSQVYDLTRIVLERSRTVEGKIDYNDQNWLPIVNKLMIPKCDLLLVDEAQDLPQCKQQYALAAGRRIVIVGDVNQAIYGFAGADTESIPRMKKLLGVEHSLFLTETRRCGKAIVREAQKIVPTFQAHSSNPEGLVRSVSSKVWASQAQDNDMVLCRVNAPLVSEALKLVKAGRKAVIRGRDFGTGLIKFVKSMDAESVTDLICLVSDWADREMQKEASKPFPSDSKIITIQDKAACISTFAENAKTVQDVLTAIQNVFAGKQCPRCNKNYNESVEICYDCEIKLITPEGVQFSSIHRAKGLEASRVWFIRTKNAPCPHPMAKSAWQIQQEWNSLYIGITRAINELVYVCD